MRSAETLLDIGPPVAYLPGLVKYLGSVNATLFFCQILYWKGKETSDLGVYKSADEVRSETGLTYREQATARKQLVECGVLFETHKRLEHRIYFRLNLIRLQELMDADEEAVKARASDAFPEVRNPQFGKNGDVNSPAAFSAVPEVRNAQFGSEQKRSSSSTENTSETTSESNCTGPSRSSMPDFPASKPTAKSENRTEAKAPAAKNSKVHVFDAMASLLNDGVPEQAARDWLMVRKTKKCANTETAFGAIAREGAKTGLTMAQTITVCAEKGWATFEAEWYSNPQSSAARGGSGGGGAWWLSKESALAKAKEVGVGEANPGESDATWNARIQAAIDNGGKPPAPHQQPVTPLDPLAQVSDEGGASERAREALAQSKALLRKRAAGGGIVTH